MDKMAVVSPDLLIITLNVSGLNSPTKSCRMAKGIEKQGSKICCFTRDSF